MTSHNSNALAGQEAYGGWMCLSTVSPSGTDMRITKLESFSEQDTAGRTYIDTMFSRNWIVIGFLRVSWYMTACTIQVIWKKGFKIVCLFHCGVVEALCKPYEKLLRGMPWKTILAAIIQATSNAFNNINSLPGIKKHGLMEMIWEEIGRSSSV